MTREKFLNLYQQLPVDTIRLKLRQLSGLQVSREELKMRQDALLQALRQKGGRV